MNSDDKPDNDDFNLFRDSVSDVRQLKQDKVKPVHSRPKPVPRQTEASEKRVIVDMMSDEYEVADVESGEELLFIRSGLQSKVIRKLKRGQFSLQAELDLHGLNVEAARQSISEYLHSCQQEGYRCVRIIHGKGLSSKHKGPVLKQMVNRWLRQRKEVLAFVSAQPHHGGTGAVYVLLKKLNH